MGSQMKTKDPHPSTPVVLIAFNRPDTTARVFEAIRQAEPSRLLLIADGPRPDRPEDVERCAAVRAIIEHVDWECDVLTNFAQGNMGCKRRVSSGLDWVFGQVDEAIILEDDCLPHPTFFRFCDELLARYRDDERMMTISGVNLHLGRQRTRQSYYFSRYLHCWGWATWRRAWGHYDVEMKLWPGMRDGRWLEDILRDRRAVAYWSRMFDWTHGGRIDTWDYQWVFACWIQSGLAIVPNVNLVSNIGFGPEATHTKHMDRFANLPPHAMGFPLCHPSFVIRDDQADRITQRVHYRARTLLSRSKNKVRTILGRYGLSSS